MALKKGGIIQTSTSSAVVTALSTGMQSAATEAIDAITAVLPIALPILGIMLAIALGIKAFKKVTGRG